MKKDEGEEDRTRSAPLALILILSGIVLSLIFAVDRIAEWMEGKKNGKNRVRRKGKGSRSHKR